MKTRYSAEAPARDELDRLAGPTLVEFLEEAFESLVGEG